VGRLRNSFELVRRGSGDCALDECCGIVSVHIHSTPVDDVDMLLAKIGVKPMKAHAGRSGKMAALEKKVRVTRAPVGAIS
jgi:hypothetical protein